MRISHHSLDKTGPLFFRVRNKQIIFSFLNQNICCGYLKNRFNVKNNVNINNFTLKNFAYLNL